MMKNESVERLSKMLNKPTQSPMNVKEYLMENMFCAPQGMLGRVGGRLMSLDHWLPSWVLNLLEINVSDSVLEVGSGPGLGIELAVARAREGRVVGVDASETMLEMAGRRNRTQIEAGRVELYLGNADHLPLDDATFDKAMTLNSLHIWPDPVAGLREIRRVLRPGGRVAVAITRFSYASPDNFGQFLSDSGFTEVRTYTGDAGSCALGHA
jgi:ubiquinone/menaquinone biosynthesis C-methylase UbiE